jgi:catechol 2,3-dioxygenase-like lactoylglutathione lyase family enzyme
MKAHHLFETALYVDDLAVAERFYVEVLGLEVESRLPNRGLALRCDSGVLLLFDPKATQVKDSALPAHGTVGAGHIAFLATAEELPSWRAQLAAHGVGIEEEVEWEQGGLSLYFRDPAGNSLELAPPTLWSWQRRGATAQGVQP